MNDLTLSGTDTTLLVILICLMSLYFILGIMAVVIIMRFLSTARRIAEKAEAVAGNVEAASETLRDVAGPASVLKLLANVINLGHKNKHKKGSKS